MSMLVHQIRVEQLVFWRNRSSVFFSFAFPLVIMLFFAGMGGIGRDGLDGLTYREFVIPGLVAMAIASNTFQTLAISIAFHREQGVLKRMMASPLPPATMIGARMLSAALVALLEVVLMLALAIAAFGLPVPQDPLAFLGAVLLGALAFTAMGMAMTVFIRNGDSSPAILNAVYLPMVFVSGIFYRLEVLPSWLQPVAEMLPLYPLADLLRGAWVGSHAMPPLVAITVLCVWTAVPFAFAARRFRWEPAHQT